VRDEQGNLLLSKGHVVASEHQLDQLLERGAFVDVDEVRAAAQQEAPVEADLPKAPPNLFGLWNKASEQLRTLLQNPLDKPDFAAQLDAFAEQVVSLLDCNVDIGNFRAVPQDNNQHFYYGYTHAIHTAVLCIVLARRLQWPLPRMMSLVKAALTMNLTILELQGQMGAGRAGDGVSAQRNSGASRKGCGLVDRVGHHRPGMADCHRAAPRAPGRHRLPEWPPGPQRGFDCAACDRCADRQDQSARAA
jgi:hypothetical protein